MSELREAIKTIREIRRGGIARFWRAEDLKRFNGAIDLLADKVERSLDAADRARFVDRIPQHTHVTAGPVPGCHACEQNERAAEDSPECGGR